MSDVMADRSFCDANVGRGAVRRCSNKIPLERK